MQEFLSSTCKKNKSRFKNFDVHTQHLDDFLGVYLHNNEKYSSLWKICQIVFVLSHRQSGVERGFSVNKKFLVENLGELSLVSQCIVYDYITSLGVPVHEYYIPNDLVKSCKGANARYVAAMESKKVECEKTKKERKRKLIFDWNAEVKRSRESIESCIATVNKDINKHSFEAEEKSHLTLLTKANVL